MAYSLWLAQPTLWNNLRPHTWGDTTLKALEPSTSVINPEHAPQACLQTVCWKHFPNWGSHSRCVRLTKLSSTVDPYPLDTQMCQYWAVTFAFLLTLRSYHYNIKQYNFKSSVSLKHKVSLKSNYCVLYAQLCLTLRRRNQGTTIIWTKQNQILFFLSFFFFFNWSVAYTHMTRPTKIEV